MPWDIAHNKCHICALVSTRCRARLFSGSSIDCSSCRASRCALSKETMNRDMTMYYKVISRFIASFVDLVDYELVVHSQLGRQILERQMREAEARCHSSVRYESCCFVASNCPLAPFLNDQLLNISSSISFNLKLDRPGSNNSAASTSMVTIAMSPQEVILNSTGMSSIVEHKWIRWMYTIFNSTQSLAL